MSSLAKAGRSIEEVDTPFLLLDLDAFESNIRTLKEIMKSRFPKVVVCLVLPWRAHKEPGEPCPGFHTVVLCRALGA